MRCYCQAGDAHAMPCQHTSLSGWSLSSALRGPPGELIIMKFCTPLLQNWLKRFSPTAFLVLSVKVQKAPAQRRGPGALMKVSTRNLGV